MIELNVPGRGVIQLEYLVSDIHGTIALASVHTVFHAALDLLENPMRLVASLRR